MIPRTDAAWHTETWQQALAQAITDPTELLALLGLDPALLPAARAVARNFGLRVPRGFVRRMRTGDLHDPLLRQVLPLAAELECPEGFSTDPLGEAATLSVPGLLHKYRGRALLMTTGACPLHCRYCFRRHYPYAEATAGRDHWGPALAYLHAHPELNEVILSGGDPLSLGDRRLAALVGQLDGIPQLRRLRIHTRMPIVLPERVDDSLLAWLQATRLRTVVVVHANHPNELDPRVGRALAELARSGTVLLSQSVLLRGVNDSAATLAALSEALFDYGVLPYYLHLLDRVQGAAHFEVPAARTRAVYRELLGLLPGFLVPRLVRERAGARAKLPVC